MRVRHGLFHLTLLISLLPAARAASAESGWTAVDSVVAVVNHDVILKSELDRHLSRFKQSLDEIKDPAARGKRRIEVTQQVMRALIDERLFTQEAVRVGLGADDQDVERAVAEVKKQNRLDDAGLAKVLTDQGMTIAQWREELRRQISQAKVANLIIRPRVKISDEELRAAYKEAQKRDPKRIGTFDEVKAPLYERLLEDAMVREQLRWLAERRAQAFIDVRTES
jgi:peptidyl-prolyl cis-trans isomerase SurA